LKDEDAQVDERMTTGKEEEERNGQGVKGFGKVNYKICVEKGSQGTRISSLFNLHSEKAKRKWAKGRQGRKSLNCGKDNPMNHSLMMMNTCEGKDFINKRSER